MQGNCRDSAGGPQGDCKCCWEPAGSLHGESREPAEGAAVGSLQGARKGICRELINNTYHIYMSVGLPETAKGDTLVTAPLLGPAGGLKRTCREPVGGCRRAAGSLRGTCREAAGSLQGPAGKLQGVCRRPVGSLPGTCRGSARSPHGGCKGLHGGLQEACKGICGGLQGNYRGAAGVLKEACRGPARGCRVSAGSLHYIKLNYIKATHHKPETTKQQTPGGLR